MLGLALLAVGAVCVWAAFTKRGDAVAKALQMNLPAAQKFDPTLPSTPLQPGTGSGKGSSSGSASGDSGSHMGIDANGNVYTIAKPYGSMSDQEKDDANKYAHQVGNVGSGASPS